MVRRFIARSLLGIAGIWLSATFVPAIETDGHAATFILAGLLVGVGEVVLAVAQHGTAILLFFLPKPLRTILLRAGTVAIAAALVTGFAFSEPVLVGLIGTTLILSLLFLFPFAA